MTQLTNRQKYDIVFRLLQGKEKKKDIANSFNITPQRINSFERSREFYWISLLIQTEIDNYVIMRKDIIDNLQRNSK